jgi:hypothetical protein
MGDVARALGNTADAATFTTRATAVLTAFNQKLFDVARGVYVDGEGETHASLHANAFALALGLVAAERRASVVAFVNGRGMACSVYGAQYLLEGLYQAEEGSAALDLMTARTTRSWAHMIYDVKSTMTLEAWDKSVKPNLDWNHAWGAAPANIIPRKLMGIEPLEAGFSKIQIKPQPGSLTQASFDMPTIRGPVHVDFTAGTTYEVHVAIPANTRARVLIARGGGASDKVTVDGLERSGQVDGSFLAFDDIGSGQHTFVRR